MNRIIIPRRFPFSYGMIIRSNLEVQKYRYRQVRSDFVMVELNVTSARLR
jgi:hypothetical protein